MNGYMKNTRKMLAIKRLRQAKKTPKKRVSFTVDSVILAEIIKVSKIAGVSASNIAELALSEFLCKRFK